MTFYAIKNRQLFKGAKKHPPIIILAVFMVAFMIPACAVRSTVPPVKETEISWVNKSPQQILDQLRQDQQKIKDVTAGFSILLDPPPNGQPSNLQGILFYAATKKGPWVRIKSISVFGRILFDLVQKNDTVQIYIPSRQTLYSGKMTKESSNAWQKIFTSMFADLDRVTVQKNAELVIRKDGVMLPLNHGTFYLDRRTGLLQKWVQPKTTIYYEDYISTPGTPPFPTRIFVQSSDNLNHASCVFNQVHLNKGIRDAFDLSDYHPKFHRDISELTR